MDKYLIINGGSSSLKFTLYEMPSEKRIVSGYFEKIGYKDSFWNIKIGDDKISNHEYLRSHSDAVRIMLDELIRNKIILSLDEIKGIGHRILHGGELYSDSVLIDDKVLNDIISLTNLGPLHHPGQIASIKAMLECLPGALQVAVFDTAFHQTMPKENYIYAVPYEWYSKYKVRKYGFHGISHNYITDYMKKELGYDNVNLIICHVGSGVSVSCIKEGICYDTSMGLTPLDGVVMGTRSGSIDPSIIKFIVDETGKSIDEVTNDLNKKSGLIGICGKNDFRDVLKLKADGDEQGILAYQMTIDSLIKYISNYYFKLEGNIDAIVFTASILENSAIFREDIINKLSKPMGIILDKHENYLIGDDRGKVNGIITGEDSKIPIYVVPTCEEVMIARDSYKIIKEQQ